MLFCSYIEVKYGVNFPSFKTSVFIACFYHFISRFLSAEKRPLFAKDEEKTC